MLVIPNYVIACPSVKSRGVQWWQGSTWPNDCRDAIIPARNLGQLCWYFYNTCTWWWYLLILVPARNLGQLSAPPNRASYYQLSPFSAKLCRAIVERCETTGWYDCRDRGHLPSVRPVRRPVVLQIQHKAKSLKNQYRKRRSKIDLFCTEKITHLLTDLSKLWQESCHPDSQWSPIMINPYL